MASKLTVGDRVRVVNAKSEYHQQTATIAREPWANALSLRFEEDGVRGFWTNEIQAINDGGDAS